MLDREQPVTLEHSLVHPEGPVIAAEHLFRQDSSSSWTPTSLSVSSRPVITAQAVRRSSFDSVARLEQAITRFLANWNENTKPFRWTKSAHQIKRSIRNAALIYGT